MSVIEVEELHVRYGPTVAVDGVSPLDPRPAAIQLQESQLPDKLQVAAAELRG